MSSKPKNAQLPPLEGPARSAVVKKSKSDILGHASEIIRAQSQKLKRELDHEIDRQLSVKIKAQETAITSLKNGIQTLRSENDQLYDKADGQLEELDGSVSRLRRLASDLIRMKEEGDVMEGRDPRTK